MRETPSASNGRSTIVVADSLAAAQWEMHLAAQQIRAAATAWETPPLQTYAAWLDTLWLEQGSAQGAALTPGQSFALWRRVLAESEESGELIGHAGAAEWAADAWLLLHRWNIDPAAQRAAGGELDYRAFLGWCRSYRARLDAHGWLDRAELEAALTAHRLRGPAEVIATDLTEQYPARAKLFAHLQACDIRTSESTAPSVAGEQRAARLADAAEELRAALVWARLKLDRNPEARIAVIVPTVAQRRDEIDRVAGAVFHGLGPNVCWSEGRTLTVEPTIGAAFDALTLLAPRTPYAAFGRWLRSPFFAASSVERFARARLDRQLRAELRSRLPFATSYRCGVKELLAERVPRSAEALARALAEIAAVRRTKPSRWAHLTVRFLSALGWLGPTARPALLGWQSSLDELSRLTPILGEVSLETFLAELERILQRAAPTALPLSGVHVLRHLADVGPGYDAVWVTGFTDAFWPEAPHGNPLLPLAVQRSHDLPYASPRDAEQRSARTLARLVGRAPNLVVSWPARVYDYETEPSPAIRSWPLLSGAELDALTALRPTASGRARETVADPAPAFVGTQLPGGAGVLGRQARCPLRAFCQDRLAARELVPLATGVSALQRGIAAHEAAEILLASLPTQAEVANLTADAIAHSVERALARTFGRARRPLAAWFELEAEQLQQVLALLILREGERAPFRVRSVEQHREVALGRWTLNVRIDRIDELADGSVAVIDYKTSERASSSDWFGPRLRDAQVPLYASLAAETIGGAVVARLTPTEISYSGVWQEAAFPGRQHQAAHEDRAIQLDIWRAQLEQLAAEFAAGDTRIFVDDKTDSAGGIYAPLTRLFEQRGLEHGSVPSW